MSATQAAVRPTTGAAALQAVRDRARVHAGQRVLVVGASGGVGTFAVQIARAFGADVTGVTSTRNLELVRSLGAAHVVDYTVRDVVDGGERYDVVIDVVGRQRPAAWRRVLTPTGTLVLIGGPQGRWVAIIAIYPLAAAAKSSLFVAGDAAATAQNIVANETLFRWGMAGEATIFLIEIVLAAVLYTLLLRPVSTSRSLAAALRPGLRGRGDGGGQPVHEHRRDSPSTTQR